MLNVLTKLETIGHTVIPREFNRRQLAMHLRALRAAGHAIVADEVISHGDKLGEISVMHYRTCRVCNEGGSDGRKVPEVKG